MSAELFLAPERIRIADMPPDVVERLSRQYEAFETPREVTLALLWAEILTPAVWDPCCGTGGMARVLAEHGHQVIATDLIDWGYGEAGHDFLTADKLLAPTIVMNPPFSLADDFLLKAMALGARKVAMIQRRAFWESAGRVAGLWAEIRPNRVYTPDLRPAFWRFDIPPAERKGGGQTCHDIYVFEPRHPAGTLSGHIRIRDLAEPATVAV